MPSVTYMNQSAPFWDFIASLEQGGQNHPFFSQNQPDNEGPGEHPHPPHHRGPPPPPPSGPWGWGFPWGGSNDLPHRGPPPHEHRADENNDETNKEKDGENDAEKGVDNGEGPANNSGSDNEGCGRKSGRHGRCGGGRRGRHGWGGPWGGRGGFGGPHGGPHHHGGRRGGGWGPWAHRGGPFGGGAPFNPFTYAAGLFDPTANDNSSEDFTPEADIFDTPSAFIIHISLPGAKKEDVGVNWDIEKSELSIAGVVYRPADEDLLKLLDVSERKVGPFERKIRLGTRANPAQVDAEGITAKLEDGILRVEVPKLEKEGFVEVRKVDIE